MSYLEAALVAQLAQENLKTHTKNSEPCIQEKRYGRKVI